MIHMTSVTDRFPRHRKGPAVNTQHSHTINESTDMDCARHIWSTSAFGTSASHLQAVSRTLSSAHHHNMADHPCLLTARTHGAQRPLCTPAAGSFRSAQLQVLACGCPQALMELLIQLLASWLLQREQPYLPSSGLHTCRQPAQQGRANKHHEQLTIRHGCTLCI